MKRTLTLSLLLTLPLLGGCLSMAPKYNRPDAPVPANWPEGAAYPDGLSTEDASSITTLDWQSFFPDEKLQQVIGTALTNNLDLRLATLNVEKARALYGVQRAELFPNINAVGAGGKQRGSADLTPPGEPRTTESYAVNLGVASWEIDLFGRIRNLKEQALQEYLATEEARRGAQIALVSAVAQTYLALAADRENLTLARSTLETQEGAYDLIHQQTEAGLATELDLRRSQTQVDAARGDIARYTQQIAQDQNALNLLVGGTVPEELLPADLASVTPPRDIDPGLSSEVLLGRPDIMAAEHQLQGANALIGAARAAFFPRISLTAAIGTASDELSGLLGSGTDIWNFTPQVILPIFDSRVWAANRVSQSFQKIALTQYEKTIQTAFREVADTLAVRGTVDQQVAAQQSIVESAQEIYRLAAQRYTAGVDSYFSVLDAQRSLYGAQQGLIFLNLSKLANQVQMVAVLGGGGEKRELTDTPAPPSDLETPQKENPSPADNRTPPEKTKKAK